MTSFIRQSIAAGKKTLAVSNAPALLQETYLLWNGFAGQFNTEKDSYLSKTTKQTFGKSLGQQLKMTSELGTCRPTAVPVAISIKVF